MNATNERYVANPLFLGSDSVKCFATHPQKVRCSIMILDEFLNPKATNFPLQSITAVVDPSVSPVTDRSTMSIIGCESVLLYCQYRYNYTNSFTRCLLLH